MGVGKIEIGSVMREGWKERDEMDRERHLERKKMKN